MDGSRREGDVSRAERLGQLGAVGLMTDSDDDVARVRDRVEQALERRARREPLVDPQLRSRRVGNGRRRLPSAQQWAREDSLGPVGRQLRREGTRLLAAVRRQGAELVRVTRRRLRVPREEQAHGRKDSPTRGAVRQDQAVVELRAAGLCVVLAALLLDDGGYFASAWGWSGALAAAAAALGVASLRRVPRGRLELLFVGGLAAFGLWALLSTLWSQSPPSSVAEAQRAVVPVAAALAVLVLFGRRDAGALTAAVLAAITAVSLVNLVHRATTESSEALGAAAEPIGYDNALGLLAALGLLLALDGAGRRGARLVVLATLPVNAAVLFLADSTGAYLALGVGLAVAALVAGGQLRLVGAAGAAAVALAGLLSAGGHQREEYWSVALGAAGEHPVAGAGAGTFWQLWLQEREEPFSARDAHGLYVETLGELGVVGLVLVAAALVAPLAVRRGRPLLVGAYGAFLVHAGIDWDWELAGVAAVGVVLGCALLLDGRGDRTGRRPVAAWAAGAAVLFVAACVTLVGAVALDAAREALRDGRAADAASTAERAADVQPWAAEPWLVLAEARRALGEGGAAREAALEGLERDASDWRLWDALAQSSRGAERERALARARSLNPLGPFAA